MSRYVDTEFINHDLETEAFTEIEKIRKHMKKYYGEQVRVITGSYLGGGSGVSVRLEIRGEDITVTDGSVIADELREYISSKKLSPSSIKTLGDLFPEEINGLKFSGTDEVMLFEWEVQGVRPCNQPSPLL